MRSYEIEINKNLKKISFSKLKEKSQKKLINKIKNKLESKEGFVVLRGLNINGLSVKEITNKYIKLMSCFGKLLSQNKKKEKIVKVQDLGKKWTSKNRGYKTNDKLNFHTDGGTYAGLMCVREPLSGGENLITSSEKIYNNVKKNYPKYLKTLNDGFFYHTRGEDKKGKNITKKKYPIFFKQNRKIHCMFNKNPIVWAYDRIAINQKEKKKIYKILNKVESLTTIKKNIDSFKLKAGDILLVNNYKVLHARKKFTDKKTNKRLLLRAWVKAKKSAYKGPTLLDAYNNV